MNIDGPTLDYECERALAEWPFIPAIETQYSLAPYTLIAVGSRETNLQNETGDGGHGHGVWQLDNRSHTIPPGFDSDVHLQATTAASMLHGLIATFHAYHDPYTATFAAYNAGVGTVEYNIAHGLPIDTGTAGEDYGTDTRERLAYLTQTEDDMSAADVSAINKNTDAEVERLGTGMSAYYADPAHPYSQYNLSAKLDKVIELLTKLTTPATE